MAAGGPTDTGTAAAVPQRIRLSADLAFDGGVEQVRAVSAARRAALAKMGIRTVRDLLTHYPRRYMDMSSTATIAQAEIGSFCTIAADVYELKLKRPKPRLSLVEITMTDATGTMIVTCFRQPWLADKLKAGMRMAVSGKLEFGYGYKRMTNPFMEEIGGEDRAAGTIVAVHPASEKISTAWMRRIASNALELCAGLDDPLPLELRTRYRLVSRQNALRAIHFPTSMDEVAAARRRLCYEELLLLELHLMRRSLVRLGGQEPRAHIISGPHTRALEGALPFRLTDEQQQARMEIAGRLARPRRANHMLLGDVGTGKTIVAAFALAAAADTGTQALMMAPTEVLAEQYGEQLGPLLDEAGIRWALLTGSTPGAQRGEILQELQDGSLCVLFGTHALLEPDVRPRDCSIVIIDEQQRFGVEQRQRLVDKGSGADLLSLTATPIPRSLALALFGDMSLSYLHSRPLNKAPISTAVYPRSRRGDAYDDARRELEEGRQVYVVCPLVGEAEPQERRYRNPEDDRDGYQYSNIAIESDGDLEETDAKAALKQAEYLRSAVFRGYEVGVLHGRMKGEEKRRIMQSFRDGAVDVLVSTTVIEVGVDVANATCMIIEDADRFGLSQLHQLRGRVGRGSHPGRVCLISGSKAPAALERLAAMERTQDGFELAEYDLSLRREGDILGNRQHGASALKLVNVVRDAPIIEAARGDAARILDGDPDLVEPSHSALRCELARLFAEDGEEEGR